MKTIPLSRGYVALVDDEDYESLSQHKWYAIVGRGGRAYARRAIRISVGQQKIVPMHRVIMGLTANDPRQVDHVNGNGLDNRRCNLRTCTNAENQHNQRPVRGGTSKYKGVSWHIDSGLWRAYISINKKIRHIGTFKTEIEAARAYDNMAREFFGEFANLNIKEE